MTPPEDPVTPAELPDRTAILLDAWDEGPLYRLLRFARPDDLGFHTPGQFVAMTTGAERGPLTPRYFAIASPVHEPRFIDFLLKREGDTALALAELAPGARALITPALGEGFALEAARGRQLVIFASGAGVAAILPILASWRDRPDELRLKGIWLYYGESHSDHFAFYDLLHDLQRRGAHVAWAAAADPEATGGHAFVQSAFARHGPALGESAVVLCGSGAMQAAVEALLDARGFPAERVLRNWG